ncbi:receptor-like protein 9DC1 [Lycium ferocissimum]|uniref:receptor-like protein 9DC1 n=1 Tax=Lycium ferocissimum TaxID=112874 RepID=UPI00281646CF|nr:receptor-like protein 9DC1 [Lycium ferocissimum]
MGCLFLVLVFVLQHPIVIFSSHLCRQSQSLALQKLKQKLAVDDSSSANCEFNGHFPYPKTLSWNRSTNCCTWDGVTCDRVTGQITGLDLICSQLHGTIDSNSSLFKISHLQKLNLAYNDFSPSQISSKFGLFPRLTHLTLSRLGFLGRIPSQLLNLSKLISLDLSIGLEELRFGPHTFKMFLQNLIQLRELYLTSTYISSSLLLSGRYFSRTIPKSIGNLIQLNNLRLLSNNFNGSLLSTISNLVQLVEFDISSNNLTGDIPNIFSNFTKLKSLSLSYNLFSGFFHPQLQT